MTRGKPQNLAELTYQEILNLRGIMLEAILEINEEIMRRDRIFLSSAREIMENNSDTAFLFEKALTRDELFHSQLLDYIISVPAWCGG